MRRATGPCVTGFGDGDEPIIIEPSTMVDTSPSRRLRRACGAIIKNPFYKKSQASNPAPPRSRIQSGMPATVSALETPAALETALAAAAMVAPLGGRYVR